MMPRPRLLVTGASGRIGRRLRDRLEAEGADASYLISPNATAPQDDMVVDVVDLTDRTRLDEVVAARRPEVIIHLASITGAACDADPQRTVVVNVEAVKSLAESAVVHGVQRVVLASTSAVYGDGYRAPIGEGHALVLESLYARTKRAGELALASAALESSSLSAVALRIFNVFGPGMDDSLANRLVTAPSTAPIALAGLDGFIRDYVHVDDVVAALLRAAVQPMSPSWNIVNVGSGRPTSNRELVAALQPVFFTESAPRASYSCADITMARQVLGFAPTRPLSRDSVIA